MRIVFFLFITFYLVINTEAQTISNAQFSNDLKFIRTFNLRWAGEIRFNNSWTALPPSNNPFEKYSAYSFSGWVHHYYSKKWKLAGGFQYFHKVLIEEETLMQPKANEFRFSFDAVYYIKKVRYTISNRSRIELREIQNTDLEYYTSLRYRNQSKIVVPLNAKRIRSGVFYGFASEELLFKVPDDATGDQIFDRNRAEIGIGHAITNDLFIELYYTNEFVPRTTDQINHIINLDLEFTNLFPKLKKKFFTPELNTESDE